MKKPTYDQLSEFILENFRYDEESQELCCRWIEDTNVYDEDIIPLFKVAYRQNRISEIEDELLKLQSELRELELIDCI
jgi:hypothetical protein